MVLKKNITHVLQQVRELLYQLSDSDYQSPCNPLSGSTIGQHVRHIIELYQCLLEGYEQGVVNYEHRKRDVVIESSRVVASEMIEKILSQIDLADKSLQLVADEYDDETEKMVIKTNYHRELAYNLEHTIHHMALIKVGVITGTGILLPEEFGVAYSTIKHRRECAQ